MWPHGNFFRRGTPINFDIKSQELYAYGQHELLKYYVFPEEYYYFTINDLSPAQYYIISFSLNRQCLDFTLELETIDGFEFIDARGDGNFSKMKCHWEISITHISDRGRLKEKSRKEGTKVEKKARKREGKAVTMT